VSSVNLLCENHLTV